MAHDARGTPLRYAMHQRSTAHAADHVDAPLSHVYTPLNQVDLPTKHVGHFEKIVATRWPLFATSH